MPTLRQVYDNPKTSTRNAARLAKLAGTTLKSAVTFLKKQGGVQVTSERRKPADSEFAPTGGPRGEYLCDLVFLLEYAGVNTKRASILTLMESNSRYVYARALTAPHSSKKTAARPSSRYSRRTTTTRELLASPRLEQMAARSSQGSLLLSVQEKASPSPGGSLAHTNVWGGSIDFMARCAR
jgi:hypothetical protein